MQEKVTLTMDTDLYNKFCIALDLKGDSQDELIENYMRKYISNTFKCLSKEYYPASATNTTATAAVDMNRFYGKALKRIPLWSCKPHQINHKIIASYFKALELYDSVTVQMMEKLCSDKDNPKLFVPTFKSNYKQMKIDGPMTHGKVFEDDGINVWIWSEVEDELLKYKSRFNSEK